MGILKRQSIRLRRERWENADLLAEEIYAILNSDEPIEIDSPTTITAPSDSNAPALTVRQFGNSDQILALGSRRPPPEDPGFPEFPPININIGDYAVTVTFTDGNIEVFEGVDPENPQGQQQGFGRRPTGSGGGGVIGQVLSGGPGADYLVTIYPNGLDGESGVVNAVQLGIASDATVPAGTWVVLTTLGELYYMNVPLWLEDLP